MVLIFMFSAQVSKDSDKLSSGLMEFIVNIVEIIIPSIHINRTIFSYVIRKTAHVVIYVVLGILTANALHRMSVTNGKTALYALCMCALYAASDEIHQLYIPGRSGQLSDMLLDTAGACFGIFLFFAVIYIIKKVKLKHRV